MQLKLNIKPTMVTGLTKADVVSKISAGHVWSVYRNGKHLISYPKHKKDTIRVYSLEKRRKKTRHGIRNNGKYFSETLRDAHWVGYYYDIPAEILKLAKLAVYQQDRNFLIKSC